MENRESIAETLNDLVQINNDRVEGYQKAIKELKEEDLDLKSLFVEMIGESHSCKMGLSTELNTLGSKTEGSTTAGGKIYRVWMDLKAVFTGHNRHAILENCEFGEDAAQAAYKSALEDEKLPNYIRLLLEEQKYLLKISHDKIKLLRDQQISLK